MSTPTELAHDAEHAADRLRDWLVEGPAQQDDGGIAGVIDADGQGRYVYGEITGYYLHWLAQARGATEDRRAHRAARALAWVESHYRDNLPPTRIQPDANASLKSPKRRNHGVPDADGGASTSARPSASLSTSATRNVAGSGTPDARYAAFSGSTAPWHTIGPMSVAAQSARPAAMRCALPNA